MNLSVHIELNHSEPEVQNNFIMLVYCSHCVYNLFIRAGNRGRWPASVKLVTLPYLTLPYTTMHTITYRPNILYTLDLHSFNRSAATEAGHKGTTQT